MTNSGKPNCSMDFRESVNGAESCFSSFQNGKFRLAGVSASSFLKRPGNRSTDGSVRQHAVILQRWFENKSRVKSWKRISGRSWGYVCMWLYVVPPSTFLVKQMISGHTRGATGTVIPLKLIDFAEWKAKSRAIARDRRHQSTARSLISK